MAAPVRSSTEGLLFTSSTSHAHPTLGFIPLPGYTDDVQGQQRPLADLEMVLDRVMSRHADSVTPWSEEATMARETTYDRLSDMWPWQLDVAWIRELIDVTRAELHCRCDISVSHCHIVIERWTKATVAVDVICLVFQRPPGQS